MVYSGSNTKSSLKTTPFRSSDEPVGNRRKKILIVPAANVDETNDEYMLTIASPGFRREHFQILIQKNILTVAATKEPGQVSCIHDRCEYDFHRWKRDFLLPDDADAFHAGARYKDGELIIRIRKGMKEKITGIITIYVY